MLKQMKQHSLVAAQGHLQATCHVFGHAWALLRPDGYLVATGESLDGSLLHALTAALGGSPPRAAKTE